MRQQKRTQRVTVVLPIELAARARDATLKVNGVRFAHLVATGLQLALEKLEKEHKVKFVRSKRSQRLPVGRPSFTELATKQWKVVA